MLGLKDEPPRPDTSRSHLELSHFGKWSPLLLNPVSVHSTAGKSVLLRAYAKPLQILYDLFADRHMPEEYFSSLTPQLA